jgi:hypothetical protein
METKINPSTARVVLVTMAAASLLIMLSMNQINYIIHGDLYNYELQFSYVWAMPYWVLSGIIFGLCWVNIAITALAAIYIFKRRKSTTDKQQKTRTEKKQIETTDFTDSQAHTQKQELQTQVKPDSQQTGKPNEELQQTQSATPSQPGLLNQD